MRESRGYSELPHLRKPVFEGKEVHSLMTNT